MSVLPASTQKEIEIQIKTLGEQEAESNDIVTVKLRQVHERLGHED